MIRSFRKTLGTIATERLELIPSTPATVRAALEGQGALASALGAAVPATWPPEFLDPPALEWTLERLEGAPTADHWWLYFIVLRTTPEGRTVIGTAGYKGPPDDEGTVEVGYGIVRDRQRRGYGSEAARALVGNAFSRSRPYLRANAFGGKASLSRRRACSTAGAIVTSNAWD